MKITIFGNNQWAAQEFHTDKIPEIKLQTGLIQFCLKTADSKIVHGYCTSITVEE